MRSDPTWGQRWDTKARRRVVAALRELGCKRFTTRGTADFTHAYEVPEAISKAEKISPALAAAPHLRVIK
jgi:hypothetical protein